MAFTAQSAATLANKIITSIFGRRLGLDSSGIVYGTLASASPLYSVTSATTASTLLPPYGIIVGNTTDSSGTTAGWLVGNPIPGVSVLLVCMSTGNANFTLASTAGPGTSLVTGIYSSPQGILSSAVTNIFLTSRGQSARLTGITTAQWLVEAINGGTSITTWGSSVT
jgi:hypothetical protein